MKEQHFTLQKGVFRHSRERLLKIFPAAMHPDPQFLSNVLSFHCYHVPKIMYSCSFLMNGMNTFLNHLGMNEFLE